MGRAEESPAVLTHLQNQDTSSPEVQYEYLSLKVGAYTDRKTLQLRYRTEEKTWHTKVLKYKQIFTTKVPLHRVGLSAGVQGFGQWSDKHRAFEIPMRV